MIADKIKGCLVSVAEDALTWPDNGGLKSRPWTREIKVRLTLLGHEQNYEVCCSGGDGAQRWGEWLYDICWLEVSSEIPGLYKSLPLALESEWGMSMDEVLPDFQKLVFSNADLRVMIWQNRNDESLAVDARFLRLQVSVAGQRQEQYLLAGFDTSSQSFRFY